MHVENIHVENIHVENICLLIMMSVLFNISGLKRS